MKEGKRPDPNMVHPIMGYDKEIYVKPTITNPNILVGDFTYIADAEFESHVTHFYPWSRDKLIIGKFCQIAAGVEFVMNDSNHQMNAVSTFPFYTLEGWDMEPPAPSDMPFKGDTVGQGTVLCPTQTAERRFFIVEKSADMRYNKLLHFAGVTGSSWHAGFLLVR